MAETLNETLAKRSAADDARADAELRRARERIRKNFPNERQAVQWRRSSVNQLLSLCGKFSIEKSGKDDGVRYTAKRLPNEIIGNRRYTLEEAKQDCDAVASPLPLEPRLNEAVEREPGSDDE
jgi:hypothetical protein